MNRDELFKFIDENIMDTEEVTKYLGISRQRLYDLIKKDILVPIRKGIYLREDAEKRKEEQGELREKYYRKSDQD
ncbi:helix-turn-helix domain-containing protein [Anaerosalibacter massiliensis]|uniref:Helix-turn-helix domain-containing protein n=1 Tax=Anaerosalibacter massiliensis TaxID=1347392 RepID=A0A9X2MK45_9FIRM|nr:helix-turn-helix domain-containing protein [Anaerosalibacter massiliensis]MCR2044637.1 helix-turn-helix domain-containing protein [Anaerosalibacter massiliensis]